MGLFGLFGKKAAKAETPPVEPDPPFLEDYAGIRAEVTNLEGQLLFTAKLLGLEEDPGCPSVSQSTLLIHFFPRTIEVVANKMSLCCPLCLSGDLTKGFQRMKG